MDITARRARRGNTVARMALVASLVVGLLVAVPSAAVAAVPFPDVPIDGWDTNGKVFVVKVVADTVYIGGSFTTVRAPGGGTTASRNNLAAFDLTTGDLLPFSANTNNPVRAIESDGSTLWVGGSFNMVGGVFRSNVAALDAVTGVPHPAFDISLNGAVHGLAQIGNRIYAAGYFTLVEGVQQHRVASLDPVTGQPDGNFQAAVNDGVRAIAASSATGRLFVGGQFTAVGSHDWTYLAEIDPVTGQGVGPGFDCCDVAPLLDLTASPDGSRVFGAVAGFENRAQAWSTIDGSRLWHHRAMGDTQAVSYHDGVLYFGFHEGFDEDETVRMLAADVLTGELQNYRPSIDSFYGVWAIDATAAGLAVGGEFFNVSGVSTRGIAVFPGADRPVDTSAPSKPQGLEATSQNGALHLEWDPASDDRGVSYYRIFRDGAMVGRSLGTGYVDDAVDENTVYSYRVRAVDLAGNISAASVPLEVKTRMSLVAAGDVWRHDDTARSTTSWRGVEFNDSSWAVGPAQFGFGEGDEATVLQAGRMTYYFRKQLNVPANQMVTNANLGFVRDDGVVIYINGVEVLRSNMPAGTITSDTRASETISGPGESTWHTASIDPDLFEPGLNLIAVEIHQRGASSSDVSFDLHLDAELTDYVLDEIAPTRPLRLSNVPKSPTEIDLSWDSASDNVGVIGYLVYRNNVQIGYTTSLSFHDEGLFPATEYRYKTFAIDKAGNVSPRSRISRGTTLADLTPPSKPKNVSLLATPNSITVDWDPATDNVAVDYYVIKSFGAVIGTTTDTSFVLEGLVPETEYHVAVRAVDIVGTRGLKVHNWVTTPAVVTSYSPVIAGQTWRYLDDGSDLGSGWTATGFNDSGWASGAAELGYGDGDEATVVDDGPDSNHYITTYFRTEFTISNAAAVSALRLRLVRDDGAVVYINGVEVYRDNMPAGVIDSSTLASTGVSGHGESEWVVVSIPTGAVVTGNNVMAVEVHQNHRTSSDISFNATLRVNP